MTRTETRRALVPTGGFKTHMIGYTHSQPALGFVLAIGATALLVLTACTPGAAGATTVNTVSQPAGISVSGQGKTTVVPDVAVLRLGVEARAVSVSEAMGQATKIMNDVVAELKASGVAEKDMTTVQFNISQERRFDAGKERIIGYIVQNRVSAKVRKVEDSGKILERAVTVGGDQVRVEGISFTLDDPTKLHEELRKLAMADAKAKAEQLAKLAGVRLGEATYVQEGGPVALPGPYPNVKLGLGSEAAAPFITPGETEAQLQVQVVYAIK